MIRTGVVGLGDMGSGLAKNLLEAGMQTSGFDLSESRMSAFRALGGKCCGSIAELGQQSDAVFVMVMNGQQVADVILGKHGLRSSLSQGSVIIISATIKPSESVAIGQGLTGSGIHLIDSPVSGGFTGAQSGTLTMMAAAPDGVLDAYSDVLKAVSSTVHRVGEKPGEGQIMKACLQTLIGSIFSATFEAATLAARAGVSGDALYRVFSSSGAGCGVANTALEHIIDRQFEGTGSHINTMHKDLTISLDLATKLGVPMHTASAAMQLFHAGKSKYPDGDNWVVTRVLEDIVGAELHR